MGGTMTDAEPGDGETATTYFSISDIEGIAKAVVRAAAYADHRWLMWKAYQSVLQDAAEYSPDRMPWGAPEAVTRISLEDAKVVLTAMLRAVPEVTREQALALADRIRLLCGADAPAAACSPRPAPDDDRQPERQPQIRTGDPVTPPGSPRWRER